MSNGLSFNPQFSISQYNNTPAANAKAASNTTAASPNFDQLFSTILATVSMASSLNSSGSEGLAGGDQLSTMLFTLLEQVLAKQIEQLQSTANSTAQPSSSNSNAVKDPSATTASTGSTISTGSTPAPSITAEPPTGSYGQGAGGSIPFGAPVHGVLTQNFHPGHAGLDFGVPVGTQVRATMSGKVVYAGWNDQGYGNLVIVENGGYRTYFGHLSSIPVTVGENVTAGSVVGLSGNTGNSTGPHLHYEVRKDNVPIDPASFTLDK